MPPKRRPIPSRSRGHDPTVNIANAATAKMEMIQKQTEENEMATQSEEKSATNEKANDDLKKLIETLKNKMASNGGTPEKKAPPAPKARTPWNRSATAPTTKPEDSTWVAKPAYTVLSRVSDHEKVPTNKSSKQNVSINDLPHSFIYRPGADGIKVENVTVKPGKQLGMG